VCLSVYMFIYIYIPVYNLHHHVPVFRTLMREMDSISEMVLYLKHLL